MPLRPLSTLLLLPALLQAAPRTQAPDAAWITFTTTHYRIHCPRAFETFGREVAGRVEGIHAQYLNLVGYAHDKPIDILIQDPVMESNGQALPFLNRPHVVLWKTEPEADSSIGHHHGWPELLLTHELAHMHHLLRPARKASLLERWTAVVGPLPRKTPRWAIEGYATYIEGKLTGSGRPHSAIRASVLRQWALEGKLPSYEAMSGAEGFLGGSMAYLAGSAYLEWLDARAADPKAFQTLWLRIAGKRSFEESFKATFGFAPKDGYQRFCAELTHTALELERRAKAEGLRETEAGAEVHRRAKRDDPQGAAQEGLREGELVTQLHGWASDLSLSPDGSRLLARVLDPRKPGLYLWDLKAPKAKAADKKADPDEPADHAPALPVLPPTRRLGRIDGALPAKPSWTSASTIAYELRLPDGEGVLQPHLRTWRVGPGTAPVTPAPTASLAWKEVDGIWNLVDGAGRPLTRTLAAAWNPVASPDGKWIYYTQLSATGLQIRRLDASLPPLEERPLPQDAAALVKQTILPKADEPSPLPPPVSVEPHPYRVGETHHVFSLVGYSDTPSGTSLQVGGGGNDVLGRLNWQVLAGLGNATGPRGGNLGAAWRGWRWAPSLQIFSTLDQPSRQDHLFVKGMDRERRGAELAFAYEDLGRPRFSFRPVAAFERITPIGGEVLTRALAGGVASLSNHWSQDGQGFRGAATLHEYQGRTEGRAWTLSRLALTAGWINPWAPLSLQAEAGRLNGDPGPFDRFHLGGVPTSLLPTALDANRVVQAALPAYTSTGNRLARLRSELGLGVFRAYVEHATLWPDSAPRPSAQRVAGLELDSRHLNLPMDVLRRMAGNLSFTLGLHRPLDGVMKDRTVGTLSVIVRP
ncbi:hypothetical protein GETHLI_15820 [Geothrix limicola]|uniref:Uncharacterized protein n=1 Tax=Geothrix limicola TaxID=2927978 RepID=A0ABQ5QF75_9BACT|nr:hypothetical protein [Geothrix limicola]GLH73080.1 hypothetical protein GETHLI_15820 [Geothrix limicola]